MLTVDEIKKLIQNCDNPMLSIAIHLAFAGSLRKGEILALTWDGIDFQIGAVSVSKILKRVRRDAVDVLNEKDILYQFTAAFDEERTVTVLKRPKTKSSIRTVYLPDYVLDILQEWKETLKPVKRNHLDLILWYSNGSPSRRKPCHVYWKSNCCNLVFRSYPFTVCGTAVSAISWY